MSRAAFEQTLDELRAQCLTTDDRTALSARHFERVTVAVVTEAMAMVQFAGTRTHTGVRLVTLTRPTDGRWSVVVHTDDVTRISKCDPNPHRNYWVSGEHEFYMDGAHRPGFTEWPFRSRA